MKNNELIPYSLEEKRKNTLVSLLWALNEFKYNSATVTSTILHLKKVGSCFSGSLIELTKEKYGFNKKHDNIFLIAQILTGYYILYYIFRWNKKHNLYFANSVGQEFLVNLMINIESKLVNLFPEYEFTFKEGKFPSFIAKETKTIIDNIQNIDIKISEPIKEILQPGKSDIELRGLIAQVCAELDEIKYEDLTNLKEIDRKIANNAKRFAKMIVNNVDSAKGHKGESELTIKDIAHNFALNASLFFRLVDLNKEKNNK